MGEKGFDPIVQKMIEDTNSGADMEETNIQVGLKPIFRWLTHMLASHARTSREGASSFLETQYTDEQLTRRIEEDALLFFD